MRHVSLRRVAALTIGLGLLASLAVSPVLAATIGVNSTSDVAADDGFCTLREAIMAANTDTASGAMAGECVAGSGADTVTFSAPGTITLGSDLPFIVHELTINGAGTVTIDGGNSRVFNTAGTVTLSGLTIANGFDFEGGAIRNVANLTVTSSTISNSQANEGGGIFNLGILTVTSSTISGNSATEGGAIYNDNGLVTVSSSTLAGNLGTFGGAINNDGGSVIVTSSTISGNSAAAGGGIVNFFGPLTVASSTISGNTATVTGGGIHAASGSVTITNSTLTGNSASTGGGIQSQGSAAMVIRNSTISGNTATAAAGGIAALATESLFNTIVAGNTAGSGSDFSGAIETSTTNVIGVPGGKTLADILVPAGLANNGGPTKTIALALVAGNPAIDTATAATCVASPVSGLDQRGVARPAVCDIGAYEAEAPTIASHTNVSATATSSTGAVVTYTAPAGSDEQGGAASVVCVPASGSTFPVGATTVTCTATDGVGHAATTSFQVVMAAFVPAPTTAPTVPPTDVPSKRSQGGAPALPFVLTMLAVFGLVGLVAPRRRATVRTKR